MIREELGRKLRPKLKTSVAIVGSLRPESFKIKSIKRGFFPNRSHRCGLPPLRSSADFSQAGLSEISLRGRGCFCAQQHSFRHNLRPIL
jgi:hypothetical protein